MTDPLDDLKAALGPVSAPSETTKSVHLRAAMEEFDRLGQGMAAAPRHTNESPGLGARIGRGVFDMLDKLTSKAALTATSGIVAVAVAAVVFVPGLPGFSSDPVGVTLPESETASGETSGSGVVQSAELRRMRAAAASEMPGAETSEVRGQRLRMSGW